MFRTTQIGILIAFLVLGMGKAPGQEASDYPTMLAQLRTFHAEPAAITIPPSDTGPIAEPTRDYEKEFKEEMADQLTKVESCVEERHFTEPGHVQAAFSVLATGEFADISVVDDFPNPEPELVRCVWETLAHLRLDAPPDHERPFHITFVFGAPAQVDF